MERDSEKRSTSPQGPDNDGRATEYDALVRFLRASMDAEAYAEVEMEIRQEIARGAERLGMSERDYIAQVGIIPRSIPSGRVRRRGLRFYSFIEHGGPNDRQSALSPNRRSTVAQCAKRRIVRRNSGMSAQTHLPSAVGALR